jgi:hypothetical protein
VAEVSELVSVATTAPEVLSRLKSFSREQLPFATALSLTRLAFVIRDAERERWQSEFKVRAKWTTRQITADLTRKREWPNPTVKVGDLYSPAAKFESGGTKGPEVGFTDVFVPTRLVRAPRSATTGRLPVALNPKSLIGRGLVHVAEIPGMGRALVLNERVGRSNRVGPSGRARQRFGARRINEAGFTYGGSLRALFLLRPNVKIPERFRFGREAAEVTRRRYAAIFVEAMNYAARTARP